MPDDCVQHLLAVTLIKRALGTAQAARLIDAVLKIYTVLTIDTAQDVRALWQVLSPQG
jgi:hypothetical protein